MTITEVTGYENSPAVFDPAWLPDIDGAWPELAEMRAEYLRIHGAWQEAAARRHALREQVEAADAERREHLRDAYRTGADPRLATRDEQVTIALGEATEQANAAGKALLDHINACIASIAEKRPAWLGEIDAFDGEVGRQVDELRAQIVSLERRKGAWWKLRHWVDRTGGPAAELPALHMPYAAIADPAPESAAEREAWVHQRSLESYAGGVAGGTHISDGQMRQVERDILADGRRQPVAGEVA